jgi:hypothetical protein
MEFSTLQLALAAGFVGQWQMFACEHMFAPQAFLHSCRGA